MCFDYWFRRQFSRNCVFVIGLRSRSERFELVKRDKFLRRNFAEREFVLFRSYIESS